MIVKAILPQGGRKRGMGIGGGVELYDRVRYMTMTGNHFGGTPDAIEERQTEMADFTRGSLATCLATLANRRRSKQVLDRP